MLLIGHYDSFLPCQFIIIDGLKDGIYTFKATVNAPSVDAVKNGKGKILFKEDNYDNNTVSLNLKLNGNDRPVIAREKIIDLTDNCSSCQVCYILRLRT